ncbi:hypothetical protein H5J24_08240 [Chryseobacterium capnotolerans]|uniref:hypothetical protein n=1 Tax=Chryseobacterium TaxID=59732 RepID=UPI00083ABC12|nr:MULTISPECIES: hypothetical protein [Chryseobacterium]MBP2615387.1 hypothetical protein [Chryseobacterium jejuense]UHO39994.1 hypothetical protein H5J24_08240 [Chryseobacterium capnotolerans]
MRRESDIQSSLDFIKLNLSERPFLINNLEKISTGKWESKAYYKFVDSTNANKPGSSWKFKENIILEHPELGTLILDILEHDELGGIEFLERL